ncbi:MAG: hypothetical protein V7644_341 [Actinomycetota bacterium]
MSGGLPAAAYLQRAGLEVALLERAARPAGFFTSYERGSGVRFDVAPVNFSCMAPALVDLDLAAYGYTIDFPEVLFATLDGCGRATTFYSHLERTTAQLARWSRADAETFAQMLAGLSARAREILAAAFYTPSPDGGRAVELTAAAVGIPAAELERLTAPRLVERLFESEAARIAVMALPAINLFGELLLPGQGAFAWLWSFLLRSCRSPAGSSALPQALERAFVEHGGTLQTNALARRLVRDDAGVCRAVEAEVDGRRELFVGRRAIVSNLGADLTSELLGEELRQGWRTAGRTVFTADLVLDRPLRWDHEGFAEAQRLYLIWPTWEACLGWLEAARAEREEVFLGHLELTQFSVLYGTGPSGAALRVRFGTGPFVDDRWSERLPRYAQAVRERVLELDPEVEIRSLDLASPLEYWHRNPAARHGNPVGGDFREGQWLGERVPYRTAIPGLYMSNSVWPTSMSWLAPGYNAACAVAEDLGVRGQAWWAAPPLPLP